MKKLVDGDGPKPMILIQPAEAGTRIDAYGLTGPAVIEELRRCIIHMAALQAGLPVISTVIEPGAAVAAPAAAPALNGHRPSTDVPAVKPNDARLMRKKSGPRPKAAAAVIAES